MIKRCFKNNIQATLHASICPSVKHVQRFLIPTSGSSSLRNNKRSNCGALGILFWMSQVFLSSKPLLSWMIILSGIPLRLILPSPPAHHPYQPCEAAHCFHRCLTLPYLCLLLMYNLSRGLFFSYFCSLDLNPTILGLRTLLGLWLLPSGSIHGM